MIDRVTPRRRFGAVALGTILVLVFFAAAPSAGEAKGILLICNKADDTVSFVDAGTLEVLGTTTTGTGPHEVTVTPNGKWAFVANYEGDGNTISLIDIAAMEEVKRIPIEPHEAPHGIVASRDGKRVYATCERTRTVIELDVELEEITRSFDTGSNVSHMLVLTPNENKMYVANIGSGSVTAIDMDSGSVVAKIETGEGCEGIDITPDGRFIWTTNRAADNLSVIDTREDEVIHTLPCAGFPIRIKIAPNGKYAFVSCAAVDQVAVFDVRTKQQVRRVASGSAPIGVLIEPNGKRAFVANTRANTVTVLDLKRFTIKGAIRAGNTPDGLAFAVGGR